MKFLGIIPARYASSRFPGKPLIDIEGKTMIQRVYEQVKKSTKLNDVVVATDDQRIAETVRSFGGEVVMTAEHHQSGTDRCAEVITNIEGYDVAINIQGDEPFIDPAQIDLLANCFEDTTTQIATLIKEITAEEELFNVNIPKVVRNTKGEAIYFSRQTIPFLRAVEKDQWLQRQTFYKHIGIYAYQVDTLKALTQLPISMLEEAEALEQLRWLENGYAIQTAITTHETVAVDTKEDLAKILRLFFNK
ncbi:3-deoxy-manno-octulosonate cytidylyltransferase [Sphingobacterium sp. Lzh-3]|uniref:3-deoxy-manno-octulosonate cytidylyltransferase n=1 Tax=unclassified Sphingobacterium TaxID=2609468 RepID=UPI00295462CB|nr:3-deoxy-manno-octulosonate cytidylyltransferase [Sphingobacterium sp. UGAL515B_05]WON94234.1 3-deoxy-manno-octulosonate cytidylyltransferase [Sphingobacterium sp. UGAL515B_05]